MDGFSIYSEERRTTYIPNEFIDYYMPRANGAFVKVYLYLLRCLRKNGGRFDVSAIADALSETENDILRAIRYWERENVLSVSWKEENRIDGIWIRNLSEPVAPMTLPFPAPAADLSEALTFGHSASGYPSVSFTAPLRNDNSFHSEASVPLTVSRRSGTNSVPPVTCAPVSLSDKALQSEQRQSDPQELLSAFQASDDCAWLSAAVGKYLGRMLKPTDVDLLAFLHEELMFSSELILHLYEYCVVTLQKKNIPYIRKVAISWHEEGITTVEEAKDFSLKYDTVFAAVSKAFGLNRNLGDVERKYLDSWNRLGFPPELIKEACDRTLRTKQCTDFRYANGILERWHASGAHTLEAVARLDAAFDYASKKAPSANTADTAGAKTANRFNKFPQRDYSAEDISALEQALLSSAPSRR